MNCCICFEQIINHKLFKAGCCSIELCIDCVMNGNIKRCPQCKKVYPWVIDELIIDELKFYINKLENRNNILHDSNQTLRARNLNFIKQTDELKKELEINKQYLCQMLNTLGELIDEKENEEEMKKDLERVILKYHLNLI
jgi:hypothetical protein